MMSHLTGSSALAFSMPRAEASMKERSPNGLGVISAQVNFGVPAMGGSVAGVWGVAAQALSTMDAATKRLRTINKRFFISFSPLVYWLEEIHRQVCEYVAPSPPQQKNRILASNHFVVGGSFGSSLLERDIFFNLIVLWQR